MDPKGQPGGFEPHAKRYQDFATLLLTLTTATLGFIVHFLTGLTPTLADRKSVRIRRRARTGAPGRRSDPGVNGGVAHLSVYHCARQFKNATELPQTNRSNHDEAWLQFRMLSDR